ncbi:MAG: CHAT domain-containing protein [Myxococcota bacterium]
MSSSEGATAERRGSAARAAGLVLALLAFAADASQVCSDPDGRPIAATGAAGGAAMDVLPDTSSARRAANAARRAVTSGAVDAPLRVAEAEAAIASLPPASPDRLALALHVLRTRMRLAAGVGRSAEDERRLNGGADAGAAADLDAALDRLAREALDQGDDATAGWAARYRAERALAAGDRATALARLDAALAVPERDATWLLHVEAEALRARALGDDPRQLDAAIGALLRASRTLARMRIRLDEQTFFERARPIHERLAGRLLARAEREAGDARASEGRTPGESSLRAALGVLEALRQAELRAYFGDACLAELETTTPERLPGTLLLYPVLLEDRVELIIGRSGRLARRRAAIAPASLVEEARRLRGALQDPTGPRYRAAAERLFEALIRPLEPELAGLAPGPATLVVVPSGVLRAIPFAALYDAKAGQFLVERIAVATLPSLHILPPEPLDSRRTRLLAAGLTEAVEDFSPLPFAGRELATAAEHFPATLRVDADFTRAGLADALAEELFDVVHVASHGRFDARASESFLLAHDGRIGLAELGLLIGRTRHRTGRPLELLVLSACETAIGDERAVLGLAGVAVQAGARSAVASLWKVHDEATMRLFARFYDELGRSGVTRAEALRRAQRALLAETRFRHPVFWSAFLLVNGWL